MTSRLKMEIFQKSTSSKSSEPKRQFIGSDKLRGGGGTNQPPAGPQRNKRPLISGPFMLQSCESSRQSWASNNSTSGSSGCGSASTVSRQGSHASAPVGSDGLRPMSLASSSSRTSEFYEDYIYPPSLQAGGPTSPKTDIKITAIPEETDATRSTQPQKVAPLAIGSRRRRVDSSKPPKIVRPADIPPTTNLPAQLPGDLDLLSNSCMVSLPLSTTPPLTHKEHIQALARGKAFSASASSLTQNRESDGRDEGGTTKQPMSPLAEPKQIDYALHELVDTEEAYVLALEDVIVGYKSAMIKLVESSSTIDTSDVNDVFGNINEIYSANTLLLQRILTTGQVGDPTGSENERDLASVYGERRVYSASKICDVISSHAEQLHFSCYKDYCVNYPRAIMSLNRLKQECEEFASMVQAMQLEKKHMLHLSEFLHRPVQRIMKYPVMLGELEKIVRKEGGELGPIQHANGVMKDIARDLDDYQRLSEEANYVNSLRARLQNWYGEDLDSYGRLMLETDFMVEVVEMKTGEHRHSSGLTLGASSNQRGSMILAFPGSANSHKRRLILFEKILLICKALRVNNDNSTSTSSALLASTHANTLHSLNRFEPANTNINDYQKQLLHQLEVRYHIMCNDLIPLEHTQMPMTIEISSYSDRSKKYFIIPHDQSAKTKDIWSRTLRQCIIDNHANEHRSPIDPRTRQKFIYQSSAEKTSDTTATHATVKTAQQNPNHQRVRLRGQPRRSLIFSPPGGLRAQKYTVPPGPEDDVNRHSCSRRCKSVDDVLTESSRDEAVGDGQVLAEDEFLDGSAKHGNYRAAHGKQLSMNNVESLVDGYGQDDVGHVSISCGMKTPKRLMERPTRSKTLAALLSPILRSKKKDSGPLGMQKRSRTATELRPKQSRVRRISESASQNTIATVKASTPTNQYTSKSKDGTPTVVNIDSNTQKPTQSPPTRRKTVESYFPDDKKRLPLSLAPASNDKESLKSRASSSSASSVAAPKLRRRGTLENKSSVASNTVEKPAAQLVQSTTDEEESQNFHSDLKHRRSGQQQTALNLKNRTKKLSSGGLLKTMNSNNTGSSGSKDSIPWENEINDIYDQFTRNVGIGSRMSKDTGDVSSVGTPADRETTATCLVTPNPGISTRSRSSLELPATQISCTTSFRSTSSRLTPTGAASDSADSTDHRQGRPPDSSKSGKSVLQRTKSVQKSTAKGPKVSLHCTNSSFSSGSTCSSASRSKSSSGESARSHHQRSKSALDAAAVKQHRVLKRSGTGDGGKLGKHTTDPEAGEQARGVCDHDIISEQFEKLMDREDLSYDSDDTSTDSLFK